MENTPKIIKKFYLEHPNTINSIRISNLLVKKLFPNAITSKNESKLVAGYNLYSIKDKIIKSFFRSPIDTGIVIAIPLDSYARIAPRNWLVVKLSIDISTRVVDSDYY